MAFRKRGSYRNSLSGEQIWIPIPECRSGMGETRTPSHNLIP